MLVSQSNIQKTRSKIHRWRKSTRSKPLLLGLVVILVTACDSSTVDTNSLVVSDGNIQSVSNQLSVPELIRTTAGTADGGQGNLLVNGSFENQLNGWGSCNSNNSLRLSSNASEGSNAVIVGSGNCVQQGTTAAAGGELTLTCDARRTNNSNQWTSLGFSFYDSNWNFVSEPAAQEVTGKSFRSYTVTGTVPQNATNVGVWLYSARGASLDNCSLTTTSTPEQGTYAIGDTGPAGGVVFYVAQNGTSGLEAAPTETSSGGRWCNFDLADYGVDIQGVDNISNASTPDSNTGEHNTQLINSVCDSAASAAQIAASYVWPNGQTDGYLPNNQELLQLYYNRDLLNSYAISDNYWSSTEKNADSAWSIPFFIDGAQLTDWPKKGFSRVRSIRSFGGDTGEGEQVYNRTYVLEKSYYGSQLDGVPIETGAEYQGGYYSSDKVLIDGYESTTAQRGTEFRIAHDGEYLYLLTGIDKPVWSPDTPIEITSDALFMDSFPVNGYLWDDDSFEIYLNPGNEDTQGYDQNDFAKIYGFRNDIDFYQPDTVTANNSNLQLSHEASCVRDYYYGTYCEVRYRLDELGLAGQGNAQIGFDIHWNIDDDGGQRDAKYSWCSGETLPAWRDMSTVKCSFVLSYD